MAQINKPNQYFNTKLYTGTGSSQNITGVGFQPDWTWIKYRNSGTYGHDLYDAVRGATKTLNTNNTNAEYTSADRLTSFTSDGFNLGSGASTNENSGTFASWNWLAAGTAPSNTYSVKVVSDGGNKYRFDDFGTSAVTLEISEGGTYTFDQADSSNSGHPIRFSTTSDGTHGGGSEYTTGVTTVGTPGSAGAYTRITVAASAPTLYYYCSVHSGMGGQANTPTTNSFSSFNGTIQSNISPNTTAGFSIGTYNGSGSDNTVGHGLGVAPDMIIVKCKSTAHDWVVYHSALGNAKILTLNATTAAQSATGWQNTSPTSTVFSIDNAANSLNQSGQSFVFYAMASKKGYSKFGSYTGNGNSDGPFTYLGFKPAMIIIKRTDVAKNWYINDNLRDGYNNDNPYLSPNITAAETGGTEIDLLSNGFKITASGTGHNQSGGSYIYMAFAENPLVGTNNIPATAR